MEAKFTVDPSLENLHHVMLADRLCVPFWAAPVNAAIAEFGTNQLKTARSGFQRLQ